MLGIQSSLVRSLGRSSVIYKTRITGRYLDYLQEDSLVGKIFMIIESSGSQDAEYSIRMMTDDTASGISVGGLRKNAGTGEFEPFEKNIKGPMVYVQTSTRLEANPENESRMFHLYLDDSEEHRAEVHKAVKRSCLPNQSLAEEDRSVIIRRHRDAQRLLEPLPVTIPYAHLIEFPTSTYRSTRDLKRFLSLIRTSAFYHQYQRGRHTKGGKVYVMANVTNLIEIPDQQYLIEEFNKSENLNRAIVTLNNKYGEFAINPASLLILMNLPRK